jgi:hypothetical protein
MEKEMPEQLILFELKTSTSQGCCSFCNAGPNQRCDDNCPNMIPGYWDE